MKHILLFILCCLKPERAAWVQRLNRKQDRDRTAMHIRHCRSMRDIYRYYKEDLHDRWASVAKRLMDHAKNGIYVKP